MATEARPLAGVGNRRVLVIVTLAALIAAAAVVGATLLQTRGERTTLPGAVVKPRTGTPPLDLDFGVDASVEARALARGQALYNANHLAQAAAVFGRYHSLKARIGSAFALWNEDGLAKVQGLAAAHPTSGVAQLNLGIADYWAGRNADAVAAWEKTARIAADSPYGVKAEDLLHPKLNFPGLASLPYLVLDFGPARALAKMPPAQKLAALARAAAKPSARAKLLYGSALWNNLERPLSAERQLEAAARLAPHDPVARTAAAVGLFTKANPVKAFSRLGPLTGVFPRAAVVRFHLGLLLIWSGEQKKAVAQLRLAATEEPRSPYAKDARRLLSRLPGTRSK
ncbi:MAG: tetratricopeptide repeat protein [Gaiellaceae bacterium]